MKVVLIIGVISLCYYAYYHFEHMHVNVLHAYANLGYDHAQHELGNRYLHGFLFYLKRKILFTFNII